MGSKKKDLLNKYHSLYLKFFLFKLSQIIENCKKLGFSMIRFYFRKYFRLSCSIVNFKVLTTQYPQSPKNNHQNHIIEKKIYRPNQLQNSTYNIPIIIFVCTRKGNHFEQKHSLTLFSNILTALPLMVFVVSLLHEKQNITMQCFSSFHVLGLLLSESKVFFCFLDSGY